MSGAAPLDGEAEARERGANSDGGPRGGYRSGSRVGLWGLRGIDE